MTQNKQVEYLEPFFTLLSFLKHDLIGGQQTWKAINSASVEISFPSAHQFHVQDCSTNLQSGTLYGSLNVWGTGLYRPILLRYTVHLYLYRLTLLPSVAENVRMITGIYASFWFRFVRKEYRRFCNYLQMHCHDKSYRMEKNSARFAALSQTSVFQVKTPRSVMHVHTHWENMHLKYSSIFLFVCTCTT